MGHRLLNVTLFACWCAAALTPAYASAQEADPVAADVANLLADLQQQDPAVRELAAVRLKNHSGRALKAVQKALAAPDLDPAARPALEAALPNLRVRARALEQARQNWDANLASALAAYEKAGRRDPKWDGAVKDAIAAFTQPQVLRGPGETDEAVAERFKKAIDADCDDPFILSLAARARLRLPGPDRLATLKVLFDQVLALAETQYPADRKLIAAARFVQESRATDPRPKPIIVSNLAEALSGGRGRVSTPGSVPRRRRRGAA